MTALLKRLMSSSAVTHPLMIERKDTGRIAVCIITSDTGLCGSYNINILRTTERFLKSYDKEAVDLIIVGRKAFNYFKKKGFNIIKPFIGYNGRYSDDLRDEVLKSCLDIYNSGKVDEVFISYTKFDTPSQQVIMVEKFLNFETERSKRTEYIFEPDITSIVNEIVPIFLTNKIRGILLHAFTAEHHARTLSMGEATQNAVNLLEKLIMQYNKIRQANITNEVIEIIASAEALKR
jgi:F-type H+-transporting ATPase subunit gamma